MGLLQVQGGEILCDGRNIFENYPSWLSHIGYIPQTIYLTDDSIRENIAFGVAKEDIDDERVWHVLEEAQLKDFVKELPGMLDMEIGERGVRLSGGQSSVLVLRGRYIIIRRFWYLMRQRVHWIPIRKRRLWRQLRAFMGRRRW